MHWVFIPSPASTGALPEFAQSKEHPPGFRNDVDGEALFVLRVPGWLYVVQPGFPIQVSAVEASLIGRRAVTARDREQAAALGDQLLGVLDKALKRGVDVL
jgi:hypothetical protein